MMLPRRTRMYLDYCRFLRVYHRFSADGIEHLLAPGPKLVAGYHGRGLPMDMGILMLELHERAGYLPRAITHAAMWKVPLYRHFIDHWGGISGDGPALAEAVARGECIFVAPGGIREGCRSFRKRHLVDWGEHRGYLRVALKYRMPIVPLASAGVDDRYVGLNDGHAWSKHLKAPFELPVWIGVGIGVFPLSLPLPSKIHTVIGEPMHLEALAPGDPNDPAVLDALHRLVTGRVQANLDQAVARTEDASPAPSVQSTRNA